MNRLLTSLCLVVALSYVVFQLTEPRVVHPVSDHRQYPANSSSRAKQMTAAHSFSEVPDKPAQMPRENETSGSPEAVYGEQNWVKVLLPARVHNGPSVDAPITSFYPVGTPLRVSDYRRGWFEVIEPSTLKSGWIYQEYLGSISKPAQSEIASQEPPVQTTVASEESVPARRYAKAIPPSRATKVKAANRQPPRARHEDFASLIQRAFGG
jgi:hypothetical protein